MRWDVGCIGFQHDARQGELRGQAPNLQGSLKGQCATKTQHKVQINESLCLLQTAIEGVRNTALAFKSAQATQQLICRFTNVQDHWEFVFLSQLQLRMVEK